MGNQNQSPKVILYSLVYIKSLHSEYFELETYKTWKYKKNWFSLFRNLLTLIINLLKWDMSNMYNFPNLPTVKLIKF